MSGKNKEYFYLRSGKLHRVIPTDFAVDLSEDEDRRLKEDIAKNPSSKAEMLSGFWAFLTKTVGKKSYNFDEFMDSYCDKKREEMEAKGL